MYTKLESKRDKSMKELVKAPIKLTGERVWRTYVGGRELGKLHGDPLAEDNHFPEEWMYSMTRARNAGREDVEEGLCKLEEHPEISLKTLVETYPEEMLGKEHAERWGNSTGVLIKIIDSLERLTIQVHPDKEKAEKLFHSRFGKTESWHILETRRDLEEKPCIYLGFKEGISEEQWKTCFQRQDIEEMLSLLHRIEVKPGETYLVKGGVPHAIGSGCLIIEVQEPTDYTIRVEKITPSGFEIADSMCHQGLGFEKMFECFEYQGMSLDEVKEAYGMKVKRTETEFGNRQQIIDYQATSCFQMEKMEINKKCRMKGDGVFSCLYILSGSGVLESPGKTCLLKRNDQFFIPAASQEYTISGSSDGPVSVLMIRGPKV